MSSPFDAALGVMPGIRILLGDRWLVVSKDGLRTYAICENRRESDGKKSDIRLVTNDAALALVFLVADRPVGGRNAKWLEVRDLPDGKHAIDLFGLVDGVRQILIHTYDSSDAATALAQIGIVEEQDDALPVMQRRHAVSFEGDF